MRELVRHEEQKLELDYFKTLASIASKSGTNGMTQEVMINIMMTAKDFGISPMKAVNGGFYVVNGKIGMSTALMADRIRKAGHSVKIPEWTSQKCAILGTRKDNGDSVKFEFTMEDAQAAGISGSPVWKKFPKQMLYNRAMATLARTLFPDVVGSAYSEDEKFDILDTPPEKRPCEDPDLIEVVACDEAKPALIGTALETLKEHLSIDGIDTKQVDAYIANLASERKKNPDDIIESALTAQFLPKFKASYAKYLSRISSPDQGSASV